LDALLDVDDELGTTRLAWLRRHGHGRHPGGRQGGAGQAGVPARARRRSTGSVGVADRSAADAGQDRRRSTNQALQRADVDRRHPILLATLAETYVEVLDELVQRC
jgi:hypothetical protein